MHQRHYTNDQQALSQYHIRAHISTCISALLPPQQDRQHIAEPKVWPHGLYKMQLRLVCRLPHQVIAQPLDVGRADENVDIGGYVEVSAECCSWWSALPIACFGLGKDSRTAFDC